jgi:hypothetical protein
LLHIDGEVNGVYDAAKLHQGAVTHELDQPSRNDRISNYARLIS